jgi:hypothetical protein
MAPLKLVLAPISEHRPTSDKAGRLRGSKNADFTALGSV